MDVPRILSSLILLACIFGTTLSLNKEPAGPNFARRGRRISLNEYLVPPPPPRHFPGRTGRVANPSPTDAPGYFSKLMNWFNPFGTGASHSQPPIPPPIQPPRPDTLHPPPPNYPPPQPPRGPPLNPPPGSHINPPVYHAPPPPSYERHQFPPAPANNRGQYLPPAPTNNHGQHLPPAKGKTCNPCNKVPWIPMEPGHGHHSEHVLTGSYQLSGGYLPPNNQNHGHDVHPAASHEVRAPDFSQVRPQQNGHPPVISPLPNPHLYPGPMPPLYKAEPFERPPQVPQEGNGGYVEQPPFSLGPVEGNHNYGPPPSQEYGNVNVGNQGFGQFGGHGNQDQSSSGTHANKDYQSAISQSQEIEFNKGYVDHNQSLDSSAPGNQGPNSGVHGYQGNPGPTANNQEFNGNLGHPDNQGPNSGVHGYQGNPGPTANNQEFNGNLGRPDNQGPNSGIHGYQGNPGPTANNQEFNGNLGHPDNQGPNSGVSGYQGYHEPSINNQEFNGNLGHPDNQGPNSGVSGYQGYPDPSATKQEFDGNLGHPGQDNRNHHTSYGSPPVGSNGETYQGSFQSNSGPGSDLDHLPPDSNPPSFGSSSFDIHNHGDANGLNRPHPDDLSSSSSVVKDSHVNVQASSGSSSSSSNENAIHFEQSPLLDLSKKGDSRNEFIGTDETTQTTAGYNAGTDNAFFEDQFGARPTESYFSSDHVQNLDALLETTTSAAIDSPNGNGPDGSFDDSRQDVSYIPPSGQPGFLWPSLLTNILKDNFTEGGNVLGKEGEVNAKDANRTHQKQQNVKRNKQVQVIIPYTSEYTPIPFQLSYGDWSVKNNVERTQPRKVPQPSELNSYNYLGQESRNDIQAINKLESRPSYGAPNDPNGQSTTPLSIVTPETRGNPSKANSSIDVRRLQKNIDNWTIQEYSSATTSSTILPSSLRPYLQPSKKIPDEYLTTTEPADRGNNGGDIRESVKTYSLAGFSFNDLDHEVSASNRVEGARVQVIRVEDLKSTPSTDSNKTVSTTEEEVTWKEFSVSISPLNKERVYVVTPQTVPSISKGNFEKEKRERDGGNSRYSSKSIANDGKKSKGNLNEFEAIERAYQVLPQAVNNLAVASTAKENVPLWGIMEHGEFASLNVEEDEETDKENVDGPVLYSGHSKVSRARR